MLSVHTATFKVQPSGQIFRLQDDDLTTSVDVVN